jgi:glycosyltransferase involved in cell wall biosynthesis
MRIAFLSRIVLEHGLRGGMEQHGASLCAGLVERGHEVVTITTGHPQGLGELDGPGGRSIFVASAPQRYSSAWRAASWQALLIAHAEAPFDCILSQSAGAQSLIGLARRRLGLPTVVILHGTLGTEWQTRKNMLWSPRGLYSMARYLVDLPGQLWRWRAVKHDVTGWITVSEVVKAHWLREQGIDPARIAVVANGVDLARFAPDPAARGRVRRQLGLADDVPLLLAVGRLDESKGFQIAIAALRDLRARGLEAQLLIAGEGVYRPQLEQLAAESGVRLLGYLPHERLTELLAAADLFVLPTLHYEGMPMTIVEALAAGLPVVASNIGGVPNTVDDGKTGLLVPVGDVQALASATAGLLQNKERYTTMSQAARAAAVTRFGRERMVAETERVLLAAIRQERHER